ncbi:uncharacterized protein LOC144093959 [Amblyomma americanum]
MALEKEFMIWYTLTAVTFHRNNTGSPFGLFLHNMIRSTADCVHIAKLLLVCGDVELNPGPPKTDASKTNAEVLAAVESLASAMESRHAELMCSLNAIKTCQKTLEDRVSDISARLAAVELKANVVEGLQDASETHRNVSDAVSVQKTEHSSGFYDDEDRHRRDNLIFYGVADSWSETSTQAEQKVRSLLLDHLSMQLSEDDILRAQRLGPFVADRCRLIVVKFAPSKVRDNILSQRSKLKGTGVSLQEDFCKAVRQARKKLFDFGKASGQPFNLLYNKLYINRKCYVYCAETDSVREAESLKALASAGRGEKFSVLPTPETEASCAVSEADRTYKRDHSFIFTNIRSVLNKRDSLSSLIDSCSADVVILTETWLSEKVDNYDLFTCEKDYTFYRHDRCGRSGGGILAAVSHDLNSYEVTVPSPIEFLCVCINLNDKDAIFCVCYRAPSAASTFCEDLHNCLNKVVSRFPKAPVFLLGDFNYPAILWSDPCPIVTSGSSECLAFIDICSTFNLRQLVKEPTRIKGSCANILDLILTTSPESVSSMTLLPGLSDHSVIHFTLSSRSLPPSKSMQ